MQPLGLEQHRLTFVSCTWCDPLFFAQLELLSLFALISQSLQSPLRLHSQTSFSATARQFLDNLLSFGITDVLQDLQCP